MKLSLADLKISTRLWMMLGVGSVAIAAAILWFVADKHTAVMEEKRAATRHVVEAAVGALDQLEAAVKTGTLSRDAAQRMAIIAVKGMRYEGEEYLWINDMAPAMVMHPTKPELDGKDIAGLKDPNGKALFVAMVEVVRARGGGFVDYMWPKPGATSPQPKISYVKGFAPWGWVVGSGIYVDDVEAAFWQGIRLTALGVIVGGLGYFVMVLLLVRGICRPLSEAVEFAQSVAGGDLTHSIESRSGDEVGQLLAALRQMSDRLNGMLMTIQGTSQSVATASAQISSGNADLSQRTAQQAASLEETAASMEELTATVQQNADNARQANQLAASASEVAVHGGSVVREVVTTMQSISASSKRIADIIGVIDGIAFQTNILALNAAVEAARAGEQGRGFAVVASEVRALAQRSAGAAKEIKDLISTSVGEIEAGANLVGDAGRTIDEVVAAVRRVTDIMTEITAASQEQSAGIGQVAQAVTHMDEATQQNAALVEESAAAAAGLEDQAHELAREVAMFKLRQGGPGVPVGDLPNAPAATPSAQLVSPVGNPAGPVRVRCAVTQKSNVEVRLAPS